MVMASRCRRPQRPALLALAVLSCLQLAALAIPAASSQLMSPPPTTTRPLARPAATTTTTTTTPLESGSGGGISGGVAARACTYTVQIKTSCSSPRSSPDAVSLAFGDVYKNEVYAARVTPARGFERCARDTFRVTGPCGYGVCYLYLRRTGSVGWTPEWVRVYEPSSSTPSTFYFGDRLPNGVWYGTDRCLRRAAGAGAGASSEPVVVVAAARAL